MYDKRRVDFWIKVYLLEKETMCVTINKTKVQRKAVINSALYNFKLKI